MPPLSMTQNTSAILSTGAILIQTDSHPAELFPRRATGASIKLITLIELVYRAYLTEIVAAKNCDGGEMEMAVSAFAKADMLEV